MATSDPPRIARIETFPIRLPRDIGGATGTAGSPTVLGTSAGGYRWSSVFPTLYSEFIETALVKDFMTANCVTIDADSIASVALKIMHDKKINALMVVDDDLNVQGALNMHDLLRAGVV